MRREGGSPLLQATSFTLVLGLLGQWPTSAELPYAIVGYCWSDVPADCDNLVSFGTRRLTMENMGDPEGMKAVTDRMPAGHRVIFIWDLVSDLTEHPGDRCVSGDGTLTEHQGVWLDHGAERVRARVASFFSEYARIGGQLDVLVLDYEGGLSNWHLGDDVERWRAIQNDPRFPALAEQLGFSNLDTVAHWWQQQGDDRRNYLRWNALMLERVAGYLNRSVYEPVASLYPRLRASNYGFHYWSRELGVPDINGHRDYLFGIGAHVGTHQSADLYAWLGQIDRNPPEGLESYPHTPFNAFRHALNKMRCMVGSSSVPVYPWIAYRGFSEGYVGTADNDLYQELVFHVGLCGADRFLFWNPRPWAEGQDPNQFTTDEEDRLFSACLRRLDELIGDEARRTITAGLVPWDSDYALTGMVAKGRSVWRFTPRLESDTPLERALVSESPATFRVGAGEITIPGGVVLAAEPELSRQGYWVIAPPDARPVELS